MKLNKYYHKKRFGEGQEVVGSKKISTTMLRKSLQFCSGEAIIINKCIQMKYVPTVHTVLIHSLSMFLKHQIFLHTHSVQFVHTVLVLQVLIKISGIIFRILPLLIINNILNNKFH